MMFVVTRARWSSGAIVIALRAGACGNAPPAVASGSPSPPHSPTASLPPSPLFTLNPGQFGHLPVATPSTLKSPLPISCVGDIGDTDPVAVVTIHGGTGEFLRDYADSASPRNFCSFGKGVLVSEILDPHHVVIASPIPAVVELPSGLTLELRIGGKLVAVAPDLSQAMWVSRTNPPAPH